MIFDFNPFSLNFFLQLVPSNATITLIRNLVALLTFFFRQKLVCGFQAYANTYQFFIEKKNVRKQPPNYGKCDHNYGIRKVKVKNHYT